MILPITKEKFETLVIIIDLTEFYLIVKSHFKL